MTAAQEPRAGEVLKRCPFCGDEMASVACGEIYHKNGDRDCPIIGRDAYIPAEKVAAWNARPSESSASVGGESERIAVAALQRIVENSERITEEIANEALASIAALRTQAPAREGEGSLLGTKSLPVEGCYCRETCGAPSIMGRQMPCIRNPDYPLSRQHQEGEGR